MPDLDVTRSEQHGQQDPHNRFSRDQTGGREDADDGNIGEPVHRDGDRDWGTFDNKVASRGGQITVEGTFQSACVNNGEAIVVSDQASATVLCGNVQVGELAFLGAGTVVIPGIGMGAGAATGAGAVVVRPVPENKKVRGVPARPAME